MTSNNNNYFTCLKNLSDIHALVGYLYDDDDGACIERKARYFEAAMAATVSLQGLLGKELKRLAKENNNYELSSDITYVLKTLDEITK